MLAEPFWGRNPAFAPLLEHFAAIGPARGPEALGSRPRDQLRMRSHVAAVSAASLCFMMRWLAVRSNSSTITM